MAPKRRPAQDDNVMTKRLRSDDNESVLLKPSGRAPAALLDPRLEPSELLRRLLAPLEPADFLRTCWGRCAVALPGPVSRLKPLLRELHDLDLSALLQETPSENVHAWVPDRSGAASLESVAVDAQAGLTLARTGAALYFRAPEELETIFVSALCSALGMGAAGFYPGDQRPRGEIETFVAGKGHVTGWHTDFQHNFTVQLRGSKTWRFKRGPVEHNVRALTPHYRTRANFEQQMKVHAFSDPTSMEYRPPDSFFSDAEEVVVAAGSVLYHPAGVWHHVECTADNSISINVSLSGAIWADLIGDAVRQLMWASPALRAPIVGLEAGNHLAARGAAAVALKEARKRLAMLTPEDLLPPSMLEVGGSPSRINVARSRLGSTQSVRPGDRFRFSDLAVIVELPQTGDASSSSSASESDDDRSMSDGRERCAVGAGARRVFALHVNFGNEDLASWSRVRLVVPAPMAAAVAWLQERQQAARSTSRLESFAARELLAAATGRGAARWVRVARLLRLLVYCGHLRKLSKAKPDRQAPKRRARTMRRLVQPQSVSSGR